MIDSADTSILSNITTVKIRKDFQPIISTSSKYNIYFRNALYNPHSGHMSSAGGILSSTGFKIDGNDNEMFFDDDGAGKLRIYYLVSGTRTYYSTDAGTVDYTNGKITVSAVKITSVSNVDGATSTKIRVTAIPNSSDVIPVRNQLLEIDLTNSTVTGQVDTAATTGVGYTTTTTGTTTTTTVDTTKSTPDTSAY